MKATQLLVTERVRHPWRHHCLKEKLMQFFFTGLGPEAMHWSLSPIQFVGRCGEYHNDIVGWWTCFAKRLDGSKMWPTSWASCLQAGGIVIQLVLRHIVFVFLLET
jgi:hypothetical protein